jgi:hypothetical protein
MGAWTGKRERSCANMDHARSLGDQLSAVLMTRLGPYRFHDSQPEENDRIVRIQPED